MSDLSEADLFYGTSGPRNAEIMLIGEAWGSDEFIAKVPFVGASGYELTKILNDARLVREHLLLANVIDARPPNNEFAYFFEETPTTKTAREASLRGLFPTTELLTALDKLYALIRRVKPKLIIGCGNIPLWALTAGTTSAINSDISRRKTPTGIGNYRGSQLYTADFVGHRCAYLPIYHPALILRMWDYRAVTVHDLRMRVPKAINGEWHAPSFEIVTAPSFRTASDYFRSLLAQAEHRELLISNDIETRQQLITCIGFAADTRYALVLPQIKTEKPAIGGLNILPFYTPQEEVELIKLLRKLYSHPRISFIGQNYMYDMTYLHAMFGVTPRLARDTMGLQHLIFPGTPKDLGYLSSLYCSHHRYWKDDNKEWEAKETLDDHWRYNGEDVLRTYEISERQLEVLDSMKLTHLWPLELEKHELAFEMATHGIRTDVAARRKLSVELGEASASRIKRLLSIVPQEIVDHWLGAKQKVSWPTSAAQQKWIFYDFFSVPTQRHRKTGAVTLNKEAIPVIKKKAPYLAPICDALLELRSIGVFKSTFIDAELDPDSRFRSSFNPFGTETYRWSSSTNPFNRGGNLQNIPSDKEL